MSEVTRLLDAVEQGDPKAADDLLPLVYQELRALAARQLAGENPGQSLQATALVHEAYLRLVGGGHGAQPYAQRSHFFAAAAQAMRRILVEQARRRSAEKRGGGWRKQELVEIAAPEQDEELIALADALDRLEEMDPSKAKLVELRYFAGLTSEQAAAVLGISPSTADRYWNYARAWLQAELRD